jgi:hypothetical protein
MSASDVYPPDMTTERGRVRALIPDVEQVDFTGEGAPSYLFSDSHIDAFLGLYGDKTPRSRIKRAAADALTAVAVSEALISKVITTEDLQTDGAKLATALLAGAKQLRDDADKDDEDAEECYGFEIVDFQPYPQDYLPAWTGGFPSIGTPATNSSRDVGVGQPHHGAGFGRWV